MTLTELGQEYSPVSDTIIGDIITRETKIHGWLTAQKAARICCDSCGLPLSPETHVIDTRHLGQLVCGKEIPPSLGLVA